MIRQRPLLPLALLLAPVAGCSAGRTPVSAPPSAPAATISVTEIAESSMPAAPAPAVDPHSFARPAEARVTHLTLDLAVDFAAQRLTGRASLRLARAPGAGQLVLDTRDLEIRRVGVGASDAETTFHLAPAVELFGSALTVDLPAGADLVHVDYATRPGAAALQWLAPRQTAGGQHPFLFTQSQAILARTWIPLQDTPAVRMTYDATVRVPAGLMAVMSADNPQAPSADGIYRFRMPQPIPSYLMALAVGDLAFRPLGSDTGVYAEPAVVGRAAWELADTQKMLEVAGRMWGPYRWGRYDLLVLPPSFPFGGMENPRLTFATPTILAGDRSLVSLVAHELAHSWSGNLVTNATWNDFWLNEGFTTYLEGRIMEELYGRPYAEMLEELSLQDLRDEIAALPPVETHLRLELAGRDPDEGMNDVAYEKGALFLRTLERKVGRPRWDPFLRSWFDSKAFQSATTEDFLRFLDERLFAPLAVETGQAVVEGSAVRAWIYGPGIPPDAEVPSSSLLDQVEAELARWQTGTPPSELRTSGWSSHQWVHLLRHLPAEATAEQLAELDAAFGFSGSGNSEILFAWLMQVVAHEYAPAYPSLERFLTSMGRRKFLKPLYEELVKSPEGMELARRIYATARPTYHSVSVGTVDKILGWTE
jgi:leukotriene-A4 hydrolase